MANGAPRQGSNAPNPALGGMGDERTPRPRVGTPPQVIRRDEG